MEKNQKGVSLVITLFIMTIILGVVLSVSALLYSQLKVIRNIGNSVASFYTAESGIEKVLYYDKQVRKENGNCNPTCPTGYTCNSSTNKCVTARGLCAIVAESESKNCSTKIENPGQDDSYYCERSGTALFISGTNCNPESCTDCTIAFKTSFDNREYSVSASVIPGNFLRIRSSGLFGGVGRQIEASQLAGY